MSDSTPNGGHDAGGLPTWAEQMRALEPVVDHLLDTWRPDGATPAEVQDMNRLVLSILSDGYLCRVYTDASRPVFMPLWNYAMNQGGPDPDYVYSTTEVDAAGHLPDLRLPRHHPLRRDHPADLRHDEHGPARERQRRAPHPRPRRPRARRRGPLQRGAEPRAAGRPHRRLVAARPAHPPAADAEVLVRLDQRGRRPRGHRAPRRPRRRHDPRGDRPPVLRHGRVDQGDDRLRHGPGALLPRAPRGEHVPALHQDRLDRRAAHPGVLRRHLRDRRRRGADRRDRRCRRRAATGRRWWPTTASAPSTG